MCSLAPRNIKIACPRATDQTIVCRVSPQAISNCTWCPLLCNKLKRNSFNIVCYSGYKRYFILLRKTNSFQFFPAMCDYTKFHFLQLGTFNFLAALKTFVKKICSRFINFRALDYIPFVLLCAQSDTCSGIHQSQTSKARLQKHMHCLRGLCAPSPHIILHPTLPLALWRTTLLARNFYLSQLISLSFFRWETYKVGPSVPRDQRSRY